MATPDRLKPLLEAALQSSPFLLEDLTVTAAGRRSVVRVIVDRALAGNGGEVADTTEPSAPLSLDDVADATRLVSTALDDDDVMGEAPYTLEVSSPGVSRPLTLPRHFRRNIGRLVAAVGPGSSTTGRLVRAGEDLFVLDVPATKKEPGGEVTLRHADITRGEVQIEFNRADLQDNSSDSDDSSDQTEEN